MLYCGPYFFILVFQRKIVSRTEYSIVSITRLLGTVYILVGQFPQPRSAAQSPAAKFVKVL